jgi:RNase P subunit RPR2
MNINVDKWQYFKRVTELAAKKEIAHEQRWRRNGCFDQNCKTVLEEGNMARVKKMHNVVWTVVAMQYADKQTLVYMQRSRYCWTVTMETVFSMWSMLRCYKQDSLKQWVNCWLKFSAVQLSEVTWSTLLMSERVQLSVQLKVNLWREDYKVDVKWPAAWDPVSWVVSW